MNGFGHDEWIETIWLETCNAGLADVLLGPDERHRMAATIDLIRLDR